MLRFHIANMTCGGCAKGVTATIRAAAPAAAVTIDLEKREAAVEGAPDAAAIAAALREDGWEAEARAG